MSPKEMAHLTYASTKLLNEMTIAKSFIFPFSVFSLSGLSNWKNLLCFSVLCLGTSNQVLMCPSVLTVLVCFTLKTFNSHWLFNI